MFRSRIKRWLLDESAQASVIAALSLTLLMSFVGLAIDVGRLHYTKRNLQSVADAAAMAAGLEIRTCGSSYNCPTMQNAVTNALKENGINISSTALLTNCSGTAGSGISVTLNHPVCQLGTKDPNYKNPRYVEAIVSEEVSTYFAAVPGFSHIKVSARAEATRGGGPCIYSLDPTGIGITVLAGLNSSCGVVDESSSPLGVVCAAGLVFSAPHINITGGDLNLLCASRPKPSIGVPPPNPKDPLAYVPAPPVPACGNSISSPYHGANGILTILAGNVTLYPDKAYCGGIVIGPLATVTFQPGTYVLKNTSLLGIPLGGGLAITVGANITGKGVTFYNAGPHGSVAFLAPVSLLGLTKIDLEAPTTGTYGGILFYQDPANSDPATILGSIGWGSNLVGGFYFPTALVTYAVDISPTYNFLVAKNIIFAASATSVFNANYSSLDSGSPIGGDYAVLVQ